MKKDCNYIVFDPEKREILEKFDTFEEVLNYVRIMVIKDIDSKFSVFDVKNNRIIVSH